MVLSRPAARRIAQAVVVVEIRRLRDRAPASGSCAWSDSSPLGDDGLDLDSLEQLGALAALAETFALDDGLLGGQPPTTVGAWLDRIMAGQGAGDGRLTVRTSGSTGKPVACTHRIADLMAEAAYFAGEIAGRRRVVALVPAHHLYGIIWTILVPERLRVPVVSREVGTALGLAAGDLVVAVPDQWRAMPRLIRRFPADVIGVSSAGPLDDGLAADLLAAGLTRLVDVYGASETGGIAMRDAPAADHALLPRWRLVRQPDGVCGLEDADGGLYPLPDAVESVDDRRLRLRGRRDGAVQVGGHNVWPGHVAALLRTVPGVADAAVRLGADGRLKAFVVPEGDIDPAALAPLLERAAADRLLPAERPRQIAFGSAVPRNGMGKAEDWT